MQNVEKTVNLKKNKVFTTNNLVKMSVLTVIAYILMFVHFPLPIFPGFLKIDVSDVPALIGGFALGPVAAIVITFVKNILHFLTKTSTGGVGELSNFIVATSYVVPAAMIYHLKKDKTHALVGVLVGTITMTIAGALSNTYLIIPFYSKIMPIDAIIRMGTVVNSRIVDVPSLVLYGVTPFNIFKGLLMAFTTLLVYKKISPILKK
ncbi:ECF transporter S component [Clostridium formicaceticum]|uniref:Riboflavin transporter n=1 Tax=Clostridium formicaceticum TaxID=1497 RepID=A0AAC9WFP6_9CLOT|nr:ECF transporter S component [Clostridium formicaceticum]AOY75720.1 ECF transporter S component [Clostridium formicaceticum]ARE86040.1 Riboflavin transporter RibU [Clostridium formicaceticum]